MGNSYANLDEDWLHNPAWLPKGITFIGKLHMAQIQHSRGELVTINARKQNVHLSSNANSNPHNSRALHTKPQSPPQCSAALSA